MRLPDDTIAAIASAPGGARRGIVRISGPAALATVEQIFDAADSEFLSDSRFPRCVTGALRLNLANEPRPRSLPCNIFVWPGRRSYTRQPVVEIHTIGSPPLLEAILRSVCEHGARPAEPGEFTLRAFLAGRIDLVQAEAVLGVIDADGPGRLDVALQQLAGGLSGPLAAVRDDLIDLLADLEAGLDFVEEDIRFVGGDELDQRLAAAVENIEQIRRQLQARLRTDAAPRVVLVGLPNAGKSSLLNALAGRLAALVSPEPGTTRDYVSAPIDAGGLLCELVDTAGFETATRDGSISAAAQAMAAAEGQRAELRLICLDATASINDAARRQSGETGVSITVLTKCDLAQGNEIGASLPPGSRVVRTSSRTGAGLDQLRLAIRDALVQNVATEGPAGAVAETAARCGESLRLASESLTRARQSGNSGEEIIAAEIRAALAELGKVVGAIYTDDILDRVFSRFCIGK